MEMSEIKLKIPRLWELRLKQLAEAGEYESVNDMILEHIEQGFSMPMQSPEKNDINL